VVAAIMENRNAQWSRHHLISPTPKEPKNSAVTQDLKLLANLCFNMVVIRVPQFNFLIEASIEGAEGELPIPRFSLKLMYTG